MKGKDRDGETKEGFVLGSVSGETVDLLGFPGVSSGLPTRCFGWLIVPGARRQNLVLFFALDSAGRMSEARGYFGLSQPEI